LRVWARVHKVDRIKPQVGGSAIVLVEDERSAAQMQRLPSLTTLVAIARILNAKKALDVKFGGKGQIRYAVGITPPLFLSDAVIRAGAAVVDSTGEKVLLPASPGGLSSIIDTAFADLDLAGHVDREPELGQLRGAGRCGLRGGLTRRRRASLLLLLAGGNQTNSDEQNRDPSHV
jgi:hypothetical protein